MWLLTLWTGSLRTTIVSNCEQGQANGVPSTFSCRVLSLATKVMAFLRRISALQTHGRSVHRQWEEGKLSCQMHLMYIMWFVHHVVCASCGLYIMWCVYHVVCTSCGVNIMWCVHHVVCTSCGLYIKLSDTWQAQVSCTVEVLSSDCITHTRGENH